MTIHPVHKPTSKFLRLYGHIINTKLKIIVEVSNTLLNMFNDSAHV